MLKTAIELKMSDVLESEMWRDKKMQEVMKAEISEGFEYTGFHLNEIFEKFTGYKQR